MRRAGALMLAGLLPFGVANAGEPPAWAGFWASDPADCARAGYFGSDAPEMISATAIHGYGFSCEIAAVTDIGVGQSWRVDLECEEMGDPFSASWIFMLTEGDRLMRVYPSGDIHTRQRCPDAPFPPLPTTARGCYERLGNYWGMQGQAIRDTCYVPTPDAGKSCGGPGDCIDDCLAATRTCAPETPFLGCRDVIGRGGDVETICRD